MHIREHIEDRIRQGRLELSSDIINSPNFLNEITSINAEDHFNILNYYFVKVVKDDKNFIQKPEMRKLTISYLQRLDGNAQRKFSELLNNISYKTLKYLDNIAPVVIKNIAYQNLSWNPDLENERLLMNENPMFFKNKIVNSLRNQKFINISKLSNAITNIETFKLLAKELDTQTYLNLIQSVQPSLLNGMLKNSSAIITTDSPKDYLYSIVLPHILLNPTADVDFILENCPSSMIMNIQNSVLQLLPLPRFPIRLIQIAATICCYCNLHFITMTKDLNALNLMSHYILQYYPFMALNLIDELINSDLFTQFLENYGEVFDNYSYVVSSAILKYVMKTNSIEERWIDHLKLNDRISADMAAYLIQKHPESTNSLIKLSSKGNLAFQVVGNSFFTNEDLWIKFCTFYQNKPEYVKNMAQLVSNILQSNAINYKFTATTICFDLYLSHYDSFNRANIHSLVFSSMPQTFHPMDIKLKFIEALISTHVFRQHLIPIKDLIYEICKVNWKQIVYMIYYEQSDPRVLCMKLKLFKLKAGQNPIMTILHRF